MYIWAFISFFNIQGIVSRFDHICMEKARYKFLIIITIIIIIIQCQRCDL